MKADINGQTFEIEPDEDGYYWTGPIPVCPCGEPLTPFCDEPRSAEFPEGTRQAPVQSFWHDDHHVGCDNCGEYWPIDGARKRPKFGARRPESREDVDLDGCTAAKDE